MSTTFTSPFQPGELVVHATHGISRYVGTRLLQGADGRMGQFFQLEYAEGHRVFVPIEHAARLSKHVGTDTTLARLTSEIVRHSPYSRTPKAPAPSA
ncbi:MAG TPA: CarD family transcriptional regulator [Candidatus Sulfotelmatobacter sp.]|nr:CarD family transcriptional regulator [Candidatus Sulfotelmatobacter sp.]